MPLVNRKIELNCKFENLKDAELEVVQLKMVIGLLIAKMPLDQRENIILELNGFGLNEFSKQFTQFVLE
jgi:hypothetical protein